MEIQASTRDLQQEQVFYQPSQKNHQPFRLLFFITLAILLVLCAHTVRRELFVFAGKETLRCQSVDVRPEEVDDLQIKEVVMLPLISTQNNTQDNDTKTTKLYDFPLSEKSNVSIVFLTCCLRHEMLEETLLAFLEFNEYPFKQFIIVNDGPSNRQIHQIAEKFANVTMLSTGDKGGQLRAIDAAMKLVNSSYVYYSEDDFKATKSGLITENIQELEKDPKLLQMWNSFHAERFINGTNIVDPTWVWGGFSFQPSVWRTSDYRSIQGGFANLTKDVSRGMGAGVEEVTIIVEFKQRGYYVKQTSVQYNIHIGNGKGLPRKDQT